MLLIVLLYYEIDRVHGGKGHLHGGTHHRVERSGGTEVDTAQEGDDGGYT